MELSEEVKAKLAKLEQAASLAARRSAEAKTRLEKAEGHIETVKSWLGRRQAMPSGRPDNRRLVRLYKFALKCAASLAASAEAATTEAAKANRLCRAAWVNALFQDVKFQSICGDLRHFAGARKELRRAIQLFHNRLRLKPDCNRWGIQWFDEQIHDCCQRATTLVPALVLIWPPPEDFPAFDRWATAEFWLDWSAKQTSWMRLRLIEMIDDERRKLVA